MTDTADNFLSPSRQRVLQVDGRRYSVRLEEVYWEILENLARARGMKASRLVAEIARETAGKSNLAAALRLACLNAPSCDATSQAGVTAPVRTGGGVYGASLENFIIAIPAPGLLIADDDRILLANMAFQNWSGVASERLVGQPYHWFFQLRVRSPVRQLIAGLVQGVAPYEPARISYIAPGRVVVANSRICLGRYTGPDDFTWAIMIEATKTG